MNNQERILPEANIRSCIVVLASFMVNGLVFSFINSYSVTYVYLLKRLEDAGVSEASSKASLVGSLTVGTTFLMSPIAGVLVDRIGIRTTTFIGGFIATNSLLISSYFTHQVEVLYVTYGLLYGIGASLAYTPSLAILGHYFKKYLGLVNGIVTAGSSCFTMFMPYIVDHLLVKFGLDNCLRWEAAMSAMLMVCALAFKPTIKVDKSDMHKSVAEELRSLVNIDIWKNPKYVIWATMIPLALFGYFVPYVHLVKFVDDRFPQNDGKILVTCIGISSGIGRLISGPISDYKGVNRIVMQQMSLFVIGLMTMFIITVPYFSILLIITLIMGLADGCFVSVMGPIAFDLVGQKGAAQAIGCILGLCSIPLTVGPPVAGWMYDKYKSYTAAFLIAGLPPMIFGILLTTTRCVRKRNIEMTLEDKDPNQPKLLDPMPESYRKEGKHPTIFPTAAHPLLSNTNNPNYTR
ncbi:solute carrier family 16, member 10 isoform X1 [Acyrthosiphon pisum]|uniref:Major facilitator superfamily (MFS) profile domain-containing protein n=1 Tax=Acyrthosiphon pisum TaxID=7029 RepID=A0A8R2JTG8_ACYPI|nr:solute carrier family 16, member 10 isoform X1 [Acyrthosiphon pisum]XP_029346888.1 solute carrier family 16, member 10 isoform X1 [Acyrthosiphon pisum]